MKKYACLLIIVMLAGCASSPVLYPNPYLKKVGEEQAQRDIDDCRVQADVYIKSDAAKTITKNTAVGGASGAVIGGAMGAVRGGFSRGVGVGAAGGAAAGLVRGAMKASQPSPVYKTFVNRCLQEKGYDPIGWQD